MKPTRAELSEMIDFYILSRHWVVSERSSQDEAPTGSTFRFPLWSKQPTEVQVVEEGNTELFKASSAG